MEGRGGGTQGQGQGRAAARWAPQERRSTARPCAGSVTGRAPAPPSSPPAPARMVETRSSTKRGNAPPSQSQKVGKALPTSQANLEKNLKRRIKSVLDGLWTQPGRTYAAFAGKHLLKRAVHEHNRDVLSSRRASAPSPLIISDQQVDDYLAAEGAYTRHAPRVFKFYKPFYNMTALYHLVEADLIETGRVAEYNTFDGGKSCRYILLAIELTSRKLFARPLADKRGETVTAAFRQLLDHDFEQQPQLVRTDRGSEFRARPFQQLLSSRGIKHLFASNTEKAAACERAVATFQRRAHRWITYNKTVSFIKQLPAILKSINDTPHSSTLVAPNSFSERDVYPAWERYYLKHLNPSYQRQFRYKVGDTVRLSLLRDGLSKAYRGTYGAELFTVKARQHSNPVSYQLQDQQGEDIQGNVFERELIRATEHRRSAPPRSAQTTSRQTLTAAADHRQPEG